MLGMFRVFGNLLLKATKGWIADNVPRLSASVAFYAVFSIAPLLVVLVFILGFAFEDEAARGHVAEGVSELAGEQSGELIQEAIIATARKREAGALAMVFGISALLFGATAVFAELKRSLNSIWGVEALPGRAISTFARDRLLGLSMVLCVGFLLLTSLIISAFIAAIAEFMANTLLLPAWIWKSTDLALSLLVTAALFAMIFKILPDVVLRWRDVIPGAILSAMLFTAGKALIAWYLGTTALTSVLGAAGSLAAILIWVYYASGILFFGAEFSKVLLAQGGRKVVPTSMARETSA